MSKRAENNAKRGARPARTPWLAYGRGHGRNLLILLVKLATVTGMGWVAFLVVPVVLQRAFGVPAWITGLAIAAGWLLGFALTLWNFPGAREYNDDLTGW